MIHSITTPIRLVRNNGRFVHLRKPKRIYPKEPRWLLKIKVARLA